MTETSAPSAAADKAVAALLTLLDVETIDDDLFRGISTDASWQRVYGGQVVAQALAAASRTVEPGRLAHSLHAYFIRPGDPKAAIVYKVERDRDGGSFTTRRVVALQHARPIYTMTASFQAFEDGLSHAAPMPAVPGPEGLLSDSELNRLHADRIPEPHRTIWLTRERPFEFRPVEPGDPLAPEPGPPHSHNWFRLAAPVPADPVLARCLLAYASDMTLLDTCLLPHGVPWVGGGLQAASLDHALWFHATPDMTGWFLFAQDSPAAAGGRGMNRGLIYGGDGTLVASAAQEGLIRLRRPA